MQARGHVCTNTHSCARTGTAHLALSDSEVEPAFPGRPPVQTECAPAAEPGVKSFPPPTSLKAPPGWPGPFTAVSPWPSLRHSATTGLCVWVSCFPQQTGGRASSPPSDLALLRARTVSFHSGPNCGSSSAGRVRLCLGFECRGRLPRCPEGGVSARLVFR